MARLFKCFFFTFANCSVGSIDHSLSWNITAVAARVFLLRSGFQSHLWQVQKPESPLWLVVFHSWRSFQPFSPICDSRQNAWHLRLWGDGSEKVCMCMLSGFLYIIVYIYMTARLFCCAYRLQDCLTSWWDITLSLWGLVPSRMLWTLLGSQILELTFWNSHQMLSRIPSPMERSRGWTASTPFTGSLPTFDHRRR